ncbi:hypothetical protein Vau01_105860 [Virgisporangium aurantiacum]|uniref:Uncharacterized protein n=1 Tax=Virgisporangium aurantiacum TaxID=175570 RepID=A0A8J4E5H2_9ACTN|nr:hypothetical protein Vau01_105860 [Virgisporangium aurantiacum]
MHRIADRSVSRAWSGRLSIEASDSGDVGEARLPQITDRGRRSDSSPERVEPMSDRRGVGGATELGCRWWRPRRSDEDGPRQRMKLTEVITVGDVVLLRYLPKQEINEPFPCAQQSGG